MNESFRTLIYVGVAAVVSLVAWASRPSDVEEPIEKLVGQSLFPGFTSAADARSLEIVQFDENSAELRPFRVAQQNGLWVIPSHGDYPADADQQLRDAAGSLIGLEIVGIASAVGGAKDHADCGVVEPDKTKLKVGDKNVGTLVSLQDAKGNDLVRLIVGDEVPRFPGLRYVRKPSEEIIYVAKLSLDKLPTEFDKWIEKDLLKLSTFDIARVTLKDYSVLPSQGGGFAFSGRMEATASWASEQSNWTLDNLRLYSTASSSWIKAGLGEQEELNQQKLNDLKTALDDLKIVDVNRKPEGLGSSLKAGSDILNNQRLISSLVAFGFLPAAMPGTDKTEIFATNGEVIVDMKDGVQYNLRFGNVEGAEKSTTKAKPGEKEEVKLNRFLFVTAQLSPHTLVPPMLEPEPAGPPDAPKPADPKTDAAKPAEPDAQPAAAAKEGEKQADPAKADPMAAERDRIKRENERKLNEYQDKKKKAEARVSELNARFADWYYVISEDVYKKIHLGRGDIIKEGATARDSGFNVDAFRKLQTDGIKPQSTPSISPSTSGFPGTPGVPPM
jgi:hypothetical protein